MTTMPKMFTVPSTLRSDNEVTLPGDRGRDLAIVAEAWFAATTVYQREMTGFVSMRLQKDGDAVREMMGCKNPADVAVIHSRWVEETLRDYNSEITKLMTIFTKSVDGEGRARG
jgi:hypothetical protein